MKALIIHHLESQWAPAMKQKGVCIETYCEKLYQWLCEYHPTKCILTRMEETKLESMHVEHRLDEWITDVEEYGYGWEKQMIEDNLVNGEDFVEGGQHSEIVWVPDWVKKLPREVYLCGCFDGECIEDMEIALSSCGKKVIRVEYLIV